VALPLEASVEPAEDDADVAPPLELWDVAVGFVPPEFALPELEPPATTPTPVVEP
jgi:hypothetical protein